ncbi:hypothetical protein [Azospirillum picis]|uniref:Permuted papain-like amidase enzyme, YaeF/YiiX, C92 family n=1 Tax=Azospirillum picis TaxID=488438 RepID=A0ABU0MLD7_9PROT|nr:hypothetical protein [Azospirillum picis]MBP2300482.1 hypothetical protein [Azospirillum picis]MDQ0534278.1 hypothetical protein [Azospirillum picis]
MPVTLQAGDILINSDKFGHVGLAIGNWQGNRSASSTATHCACMAIVHATNSGVILDGWGQKAVVFRPLQLSVTEVLAVSKIAEEIRNGAQYGAARAVFKSWTGSSSYGKGARERLDKYRSRLRMNDTGGTALSIVKNVFCSELVILAYQLALNEDHAQFIRLDGMHSLPSTLKTYLTGRSNAWRMEGDYVP